MFTYASTSTAPLPSWPAAAIQAAVATFDAGTSSGTCPPLLRSQVAASNWNVVTGPVKLVDEVDKNTTEVQRGEQNRTALHVVPCDDVTDVRL